MAQQVHVEMVDDIDGGEAAQTVPFMLDGVSYEIDLSDDNASRLRSELSKYIGASRRTGGRKIRVALGQSTTGEHSSFSAPTSANRAHNQEVRAWAAANGYEISSRGRIGMEVTAAYEAAMAAPAAAEPEEEAPAKPARRRAPRKKKTEE
ncbi:histone-like nucleoid-structuring protein Lsr2 [Amycolatopsis sp. H20-H5]|uniref:histone-like nucleoid-structuring protein Lsr2 n=1 Tax=Amycolatopsis sp. H20-H5 TaxID=3046309 RepID=UPI002DBB6DE1|nr:Lsr2 family protein [Amycolatopsis sp. H20-H5]MEC3978181.1 Lsr2 family protein [Amycolatopsis sp. H20-H5]